jgi:hypothetical protein
MTAAIAAEHMQFDTIEVFNYTNASGDDSDKYPDDYLRGGKCTHRALVQCKNCGTLFCENQREEILCLDDGICIFTTYYPVICRDEALSISKKSAKDVWIERMIWIGGTSWSWDKPEEGM